jgi:hypothetical protein
VLSTSSTGWPSLPSPDEIVAVLSSFSLVLNWALSTACRASLRSVMPSPLPVANRICLPPKDCRPSAADSGGVAEMRRMVLYSVPRSSRRVPQI